MIKKRIKIYIFIFLNLVFIGLIAFNLREFSKIFTDYLEIKKKQIEAEKVFQKYRSDLNFLKENKIKIKIFENSFVDYNNPLLFISFLEEEAIRNNLIVAFTNITASEQDGKKNSPNQLNFTMKLCGSFPDLSTFLGTLEQSPYVLRVKSLSIQRVDKEEPFREEDKCSGLPVGQIKALLEIETPIKILK